MNLGRGSGNGVCLHFQDDATSRMQEYTDLFRKAKMAVKHSIVIKQDGKAGPLDVDHAPGGIHEFIGQRLPDEVYLYFQKGVLGPRILNWLASSEFLMHSPLDGGESQEYRSLVKQQLTSIQTLAIGLLASPLHYYYQHHDIDKRVWFEKEQKEHIVLKSEYDRDRVKSYLESWNVPQSVFGEEFNKHLPVSRLITGESLHVLTRCRTLHYSVFVSKLSRTRNSQPRRRRSRIRLGCSRPRMSF
jgi:hypothetical protein